MGVKLVLLFFMNKKSLGYQIALIYFITGFVLVIYSIIQQGSVRLDQVFRFWLNLTPIVIIGFGIQCFFLIYTKCHPQLGKLFKVVWWIILMILILFSSFLFYKLFNYWQSEQVYKQKYANIQPPVDLMVGGMGPNTLFVWQENLNSIPSSFYFEREDIRGYKIYVSKSNSTVQLYKPQQYTLIVVENPGKWISYYKLEE